MRPLSLRCGAILVGPDIAGSLLWSSQAALIDRDIAVGGRNTVDRRTTCQQGMCLRGSPVGTQQWINVERSRASAHEIKMVASTGVEEFGPRGALNEVIASARHLTQQVRGYVRSISGQQRVLERN